jgi:hypothetical protein
MIATCIRCRAMMSGVPAVDRIAGVTRCERCGTAADPPVRLID